MTETNTIANLDNISSLAYNDLFAIDDLNDLDIFGAPISKNVSALQMSNYINRSFGNSAFIAVCDLARSSNLAGTYSNGTLGVGATLTVTATGALVIDSVTVQTGWRILLAAQTTGFQNGIYTVTNPGDVGVQPILTRATDYDEATEIVLGSFTSLQRGAVFAGKSFVQTNVGITVGTSNIIFSTPQSNIIAAGASLTIGGSGATIINSNGGGVITVPPGTKTLLGSGDNISVGTITSNSHTFNTGTGIKTDVNAGNTALIASYDVDSVAYKTFGTLTANNTPTLAFLQPSGGLMTWDGGAIGTTTPAPGIFTGIMSGTNPASGIVGELLQGSLASGSAVTLNTGVNTDIISVAYTAGSWLVTANPRFVYGTNTSTVILVFVGTASGDNQTGATAYNTNHIEHPTAGSSGTAGGTIQYIFNTNSSGTLYLKMNAVFTIGTATAYGAMQMARIC